MFCNISIIWLNDTDRQTDSHTPNIEMLSHLKIVMLLIKSLKEEVKSVQDKNAEEINLNIKEGVKLTANHSNVIIRQIKVFKDEVFSLEEENGKKVEYIIQLLDSEVGMNFMNTYNRI